MARKPYVPQRGDLVWLEFDPQAGHEQSGRLPGIVVSPDIYNQPSGLALVCPITSRIKGYPFEVLIDEGKIKGAVLADQVRSVDWKQRNASLIARASEVLLAEVIGRMSVLLSEGTGDAS